MSNAQPPLPAPVAVLASGPEGAYTAAYVRWLALVPTGTELFTAEQMHAHAAAAVAAQSAPTVYASP